MEVVAAPVDQRDVVRVPDTRHHVSSPIGGSREGVLANSSPTGGGREGAAAAANSSPTGGSREGVLANSSPTGGGREGVLETRRGNDPPVGPERPAGAWSPLEHLVEHSPARIRVVIGETVLAERL